MTATGHALNAPNPEGLPALAFVFLYMQAVVQGTLG